MYDGQEELDNLVWDKNDEDSDEAQNRMRLKSTCRKVEELAMEKFGKPATLISPLISGGFNVHYRIRLEGTSPDVMVRLPFPSLVPFPGEKTIHEAATAAFIAKQTQLLIPRQLFYGQDSTVGPFVIMERIENCGTASSRLTIPSDDLSTQHVLDPNVSETTIEDIWGKFILDPPWWLLLETAETWSSGIDEWRETYEMRLKTWLSAMIKAEAELPGPIHLSAPLSTYMRESWETGRFFLSYGAKKSWAFDTMYWGFLDERFFGDREKGVLKDDLWRTRVHLLSKDERAAMDPFVERKMAESKERRIVDWDPTEAKQRFSELLFD
ncbi:putative phosphotransferase [Colletotrichum sublineola]|uniref:Putative phosphotransferase n=1 Tax=Colletotrichum sublineola TaxID=1173701 RepID=A0A066XHM2_COLSU|nr:putative phosphotransferase [Colletotrichum sublineola]